MSLEDRIVQWWSVWAEEQCWKNRFLRNSRQIFRDRDRFQAQELAVFRGIEDDGLLDLNCWAANWAGRGLLREEPHWNDPEVR